ncbi:MAG: toll/interleukin-1 receptor domain-containing protein [Acidimicrobiia bacterium]
MDTAEERRQAPESPVGVVYDGFMSYSHAAGDLLAPRLQAGLQRFAKPWWKRRALRIFRDEASLSANPHLWSSITKALDQSGWFVLLLSRDAAQSEWVNREVEYWLEHKDPERIIPVLTEGEFSWADDDIVSDTAPPALHGAFSAEPRWVDFRFARSEHQLGLNNASFRAGVADIASAIRGVAKDELESEEVTQHRRTIRTAWAAGIVLLLLAVVAIGAAIYAGGQRLNRAKQRPLSSLARCSISPADSRALLRPPAATSTPTNATSRYRCWSRHHQRLGCGS